MTATDAYDRAADLIADAEAIAARRAEADPLSDWTGALATITIARRPHSLAVPSRAPIDAACADLLASALDSMDAIPVEQRRPTHSLDRTYIAVALAEVQDLQA